MCSPLAQNPSRKGSTQPEIEFDEAVKKRQLFIHHLSITDPLVQDLVDNKLFTIISHVEKSCKQQMY